jgi:alkanesulfonate monooxygenase SsuD/methylene tetrahydromethanopterin reductase-like flavin-dependent oxidoreductase (luciferase family)
VLPAGERRDGGTYDIPGLAHAQFSRRGPRRSPTNLRRVERHWLDFLGASWPVNIGVDKAHELVNSSVDGVGCWPYTWEEGKVKTGLSFLFMGTDREGTDLDIYREELELASMAEPLGFDSVWAVEHHFTDYSMIPSPLQFLSFMAGRTLRVDLGTMVVVLPWHNPARLAGEIAMLDNLSNGRLRLGLGRGLGRLEFEGLNAVMSNSREVFDETAEALLAALETGFIEADGNHVKVPRREVRPHPTGSFVGRSYGAAVSPESVEAMARIGAGLLIIPQKPWATVVSEIALYRETFAVHHPKRRIPDPIVAVHIYCGRDGTRAADKARFYNMRYYDRVMDHYDLAGKHFAAQKGYSYYARIAERLDESGRDAASKYFSDLHVCGTPAQCLEKIEWIRSLVKCDTLLGIFSYSGIPFRDARENLLLYAEEIKPVVQKM